MFSPMSPGGTPAYNFTFTNYASGDMLYVIREAVYLYKDYPDLFGRLRQRGHAARFQLGQERQGIQGICAGITGRALAGGRERGKPLSGENAPEAVGGVACEKRRTGNSRGGPCRTCSTEGCAVAEEAVRRLPDGLP